MIIEGGKIPKKIEVCLFLGIPDTLCLVQKSSNQLITLKIKNYKWKDWFWKESRTLSLETIGKMEK